MKKSILLWCVIAGLCTVITGCSNPFDYMPDLTEEQGQMIAEYAAGIMVKHDKYNSRLASDAEIVAADERAALLEASRVAAELEKEKGEEKREEETSAGNHTPGMPHTSGTTAFPGIARFCGLDGFEISYTGHMLCDSYPEGNEGENMVFAMDATEGNKLLVLQFRVNNLTGTDAELNMFERDVRFKISVNGGEMKNVLSTMLLDDLSIYKDIVPAGEGRQMVLVREITTQEAADIQTISLYLKNVSDSATTLLE